MLSADINIFLQLLRGSLWGQPIDGLPILPDWENVYRLAAQQTVTAVVFDAVKQLPKEQAPATDLLLKWYGTAALTENLNRAQNQDLASLVSFLGDEGISSRLMKGQGCASLYPNPLHRQCGDIDLFVGEEQYERSKSLIVEKGIEIEKESAYDAHFRWNSTLVEMHRMESLLYWPSLNKKFQRICREEEWQKPCHFEACGQKIATFNPTFNAFYTFVHLYHHFLQVGIGLRQVCDWMLLLKHYENDISWERLHQYIRSIGAERAWQTFYGLAVEHLGLHLETKKLSLLSYKQKDVDFLLKDILTVGNFGKYGNSMQTRSFGGGLKANLLSFFELFKRLLRVSKFGRREAMAYPFWKMFCERNLLKRYLSKG